MANYISQVMTPKLSAEHIAKVSVPVNGLIPGQVVVADTFDATITGNHEVFVAGAVTAENLNSKHFAIVLNDGFETLEDGRRPAGQPNYYQYTFTRENEVAPIVFLDRHIEFNIGSSSIVGGKANVGQYLYPTAGSTQLTAGDSIPSGTGCALKVMATYNTPIGGMFGGGFEPSYVCIAQ